jgi:hypothetical protein
VAAGAMGVFLAQRLRVVEAIEDRQQIAGAPATS